MRQGTFQVEAITEVPALETLVPEWEHLAQQNGGDVFFLRPAWFLSWIAHIQPEAKPLVLTIRRAGSLVALLPLCLAPSRFGFRAVGFGGSDLVCGEYLGALCDSEQRPKAMQAAFNWLASAEPRWDILRLNAVAAHDELTADLQQWSSTCQFSFLKLPESVCPYIELP
ncbi:MAG: hypothetical protein JO065_18050, partial [Acidobacteria bacterium]|nr:hypothetical protein [Acidobacteriota bacterium]